MCLEYYSFNNPEEFHIKKTVMLVQRLVKTVHYFTGSSSETDKTLKNNIFTSEVM